MASNDHPAPPGYHVETFDVAERAALGRFFTNLDGPVFAIVNRTRVHDAHAIGAYIISMASEVSDCLEVLWLMRHSGCDPIAIVPLFETIDDLLDSGWADYRQRLGVAALHPANGG